MKRILQYRNSSSLFQLGKEVTTRITSTVALVQNAHSKSLKDMQIGLPPGAQEIAIACIQAVLPVQTGGKRPLTTTLSTLCKKSESSEDLIAAEIEP